MILKNIGPGYQFPGKDNTTIFVHRIVKRQDKILSLSCFWRFKNHCGCAEATIAVREGGYDTEDFFLGKELNIGLYTITTGLAMI